MLNTFLVKHPDGKIEPLDDLTIYDSSASSLPCFVIRDADPRVHTRSLQAMNDIVRMVTGDFRSALQQLDDDIEALTTRRDDIRHAAFGQCMEIGESELKDFMWTG